MQLWRAAPRDRRPGRRTEVARPRAAVRRPRPRAAAREGALPRQRRRAQGASALDHRHRRHRQVPARLGALQVPRRHLPGRGLAPRPLPGLRRRRDVLGARRDGPDARRHRRGRGRRNGVVEARRRSRERRRRRRGTRVDPPARRPAPVARGALGSRTGRALRRVASLLRTARGARRRSCSSSRTCSGPTPRCSNSSTYLLEWSRNHAILVVALARPGSAEGKAQWAAGSGTRPRSLSSPCRPRRWRPCSTASYRVSRMTFARRSSSVRKGFPSTPSRRCACSSTVACSSRSKTSTGPRARSRRSKYRRPSRR